MVVVKIYLWPHGDESKARQIGEARIALVEHRSEGETGQLMKSIANYEVELRHAGSYWGKPGNWKTGKLMNHVRGLSPYHLVMRAIAACIGK